MKTLDEVIKALNVCGHDESPNCSQYRDGWNDAMMFIFKGGPGYRPYRKDRKYES